MNTQLLENQIESRSEPITDASLAELSNFLDQESFFSSDACVLFDLDETLRSSLEDGLMGRFGMLPDDSIELLLKLKESGCNVAIVTNQPRTGHQVSKMRSKLSGFKHTSAMKFFEENDIPVFGYESPFPGVGPAHFIIKTLMGSHYKSGEKSIDDVATWIYALENSVTRVAWVGNNARDVAFGKRLHRRLSDDYPDTDSNVSFKTFRLPDFRSQGFKQVHNVLTGGDYRD